MESLHNRVNVFSDILFLFEKLIFANRMETLLFSKSGGVDNWGETRDKTAV